MRIAIGRLINKVSQCPLQLSTVNTAIGRRLQNMSKVSLVSTKDHVSSATTDELFYTIKQIDGRGKGLIATKKIPKGTVVLVESPLLTVKNYHEEKNVIKALKQTTSDQRKIILELFNPNDNDEEHNSLDNNNENHIKSMLDIFNCNSLESFHDPGNGNLYRTLSRVNHSCIPNVIWSGTRDDWARAELRVCVNIEEGEELVASYLGTDHCYTRKTRRDDLRTIWGFNCDCCLCSLTGENLEQNEQDRKNINLLSENVKEFIDNPMESAEKAFCSAIERLELVIKHEQEMLEGLLDAYVDCYILSSFLVGTHEGNVLNKDSIDPKFYKDKALALAKELGDCYARDCQAIMAHMGKMTANRLNNLSVKLLEDEKHFGKIEPISFIGCSKTTTKLTKL